MTEETTIYIPPPPQVLSSPREEPALPPPQMTQEQERRQQRELAYIRQVYTRFTMLLVGLAILAVYLAGGYLAVVLVASPDLSFWSIIAWTVLYALVLAIGFWLYLGRHLAKHAR